ncbi:MAG: hypothetical protein H0V80_13075, partial [Acidobacteria bacterium]|nr:hypothetical protein [Acidobacteriota bacterium]
MAVDARIEQLRAFREALATDLTAWQASQRTVTCDGLCGIASFLILHVRHPRRRGTGCRLRLRKTDGGAVISCHAMTSSLLIALGALAVTTFVVQAQVPAAEVQIAGAVQAAPPDQQATATVIGLDAQSKPVTLRKGTGVLVCLADDPRVDKFNVACYHKDLEPFMARGRELAALGTKGRGPEDLRWNEIKNGTLVMPKEPRLTTIVQGTAFDAATGTVADSYTRWVIYTPGATPESTGL